MTEIVIRICNQVKVFPQEFLLIYKGWCAIFYIVRTIVTMKYIWSYSIWRTKYIYFIKYIIIYNKFNYIFYILYIHSYCLMINPTVCCKVCSKNEYTFFQVYLKVINTYIHISFIPSYTYIYTTYCIRFYIYIISNVSYFIFHHHLSLSQRKIFLVNSEKTEQSADSPQLLPDWVAQLPLYVHRSPFPAPPSLPTCSEYKALWIKNVQ